MVARAMAMPQRNVGRSGLRVSAVGLGCNTFGARIDRAQSVRVVHAALDSGVTLFDTADIYGGGDSETFLGEALRGRRDAAVIATKFGMPTGVDETYDRGGSRTYVRRAVERSLRRLGTDYVDLYQLHVPDAQTPIEETLSVLDDLVREGKVRYVGWSNVAGWQVADADWTALAAHVQRFVSVQNEYSLLRRGVEREVTPACERFGLGILPYFPLASGLLTGKYNRGEPPPPGTRLHGHRNASLLEDGAVMDVVDGLRHLAEERGVTLLHVAVAGLAAQRCVASVIAGATAPEQVAANAAAIEWEPSGEDLAEIDRITRPAPHR
jgi:aryl-alcohol dehydrogenase-like predicted oxidoreductase